MSEPEKKFFFNHHLFGCSPVFPCDNCKVVNFLKRKLGDEVFGELHDEILGIPPAEKAQNEQQVERAPIGTSIDELCLSIRTRNPLINEGIVTIEELSKKTPIDLLKVPNFGRRSLNEVVAVLGRRDLKLKEE